MIFPVKLEADALVTDKTSGPRARIGLGVEIPA